MDERAAGRRLDVYLSARFSSFSRTRIARHIRAGEVLRNGRPTKASALLQVGDVLRLFVPGLAPQTPPPPLPDILFEDDDLLVLNKPSGMLVHPSGDAFVWGLIGLVKRARPQARIDLVHRLDRETSGVLLLTKNLQANNAMKAQFRDRSVQKTYLAIVHGIPTWRTIHICAPLGVAQHSAINLRRGVSAAGQSAHTTVCRQQTMDALSLVACTLHTGRTHQIRAHLEHVGHPILGDKIYGQPDETFLHWLDGNNAAELEARVGFPRHALHAWRLVVSHPSSGQTVSLQAPLPQDMRRVVTTGVPETDAAALD